MRKIKFAAITTAVLLIFIVGTALADAPDAPSAPEAYEGSVGSLDASSEFDVEGADPVSFILNGAFDEWSSGGPTHWTMWTDSKSGWETARASQVDLAEADGMNDALGFFIRNVGGSGGYYAGATQPLSLVTTGGNYFVNVSETIWYGGDTLPYNSVAWYAISDSATAAGVSAGEWRELDPYTYQCPNGDGMCIYSGRDETVWIDPGQYFHIMVGMKFPVYNAWSFFVIDDISIVPADGSDDAANGYYDWVNDDPSDVKWHLFDEDCVDCSSTDIHWDPATVH